MTCRIPSCRTALPANGGQVAGQGLHTSPCGEVIIQNPHKEIYGTGHCSVINIPGTDEWRIVYHRINRHFLNDKPGIHRQVCIDRLSFNQDGTIKRIQPTQ